MIIKEPPVVVVLIPVGDSMIIGAAAKPMAVAIAMIVTTAMPSIPHTSRQR
jgi:hypothetical protein